MTRKTFCTLSTANLLHNLRVVKAAAPRTKIMAMVKANAYGHGLRSVALRLDQHVDALGVASIDEALALRQAGVKAPITLMEGVFAPDELPLALQHGFSVVFHAAHQIIWLNEAGLSGQIAAWVKIDTGMGRLGFAVDDVARILYEFSNNPHVMQPVGLMSHFACADTPMHPLNKQQIDAFQSIAHLHDGAKSFCNSAAIFAFPDLCGDWVRPGLALYGASPLEGKTAASFGLKPVMSFRSELIAARTLDKGKTIGYGARYACPETMPVGIIAVGYGDGYMRSVRDGIPVLVNGVRCPLIGRVSMDMAAVDLRPCPQAQEGDAVVLWGEGLPVEDLTIFTDRIAYDILTNVQNRVKFSWIDD